MQSRAGWRRATIATVAWLGVVGCAEQAPPEETVEAEVRAAEAAAPEAEVPALPDDGEAQTASPDGYWLLTEFDWGDDREVVLESTLFDPHYACHGRARGVCALVQVMVDGEQLLARFQFHEDRLFQVAFLTPDLEGPVAEKHLWRVWRHLGDYTTRHLGEPAIVSVPEPALPDLTELAFGPPVETRLWRAPGIEARLMVGRRDTDVFYTGVFFTDPEQPEAWEAHLARLAERDAAFRERRASNAATGADDA